MLNQRELSLPVSSYISSICLPASVDLTMQGLEASFGPMADLLVPERSSLGLPFRNLAQPSKIKQHGPHLQLFI